MEKVGECNYTISSFTTLSNVVFWDNTDDASGRDVYNSGPAPIINYTCSQQDLTVFGSYNQTLVSDPFIVGGNGELFLDQSSACVNAGSDASADDESTGFITLGLTDWRIMTTSSDSTPDSGIVDMGRHYEP